MMDTTSQRAKVSDNPFASSQPSKEQVIALLQQQNSLKVNFGNLMDVTERNPMVNRFVNQKIEYSDLNLMSNRSQEEENKQNNNNALIDGQSSKCFIELLNGQPVRNIRNIFKNTNRVEMEFYRGFRGFFWFLFQTIFRVDHVVAGIHLLMVWFMTYFDTQSFNESKNLPIMALGFSVGLNGILNVIYDLQLRSASGQVNQKPIEKFIFTKKQKLFQTKTWEDLEVGDIIKVDKNKELPADVMILDISGNGNEQTCHILGGMLSDMQLPQLKRSHQGTSNKTSSRLTDAKVIEQLSGIVKWEFSSNANFSGTLKLNDNPSAFQITMENIILRGSRIYHTKDSDAQIICLVLNVGDQCMTTPFRPAEKVNALSLNFFLEKMNGRSSDLKQQLNLICVFQFCLSIMAPIFFGILKFLLLKETAFVNFETKLIEKVNAFQFYVMSFNVFMNNYPYLVMVTFDICALVHALFIYWDINLIPAEVHVNNYNCIPKLGLVNNIFLSLSSLFGYLSYEVVTVQFGNSRYQAEQDTKMQKTGEQNEDNLEDSDSVESDEETRQTIDYVPHQVRKNKIFVNKELNKACQQTNSVQQAQMNELLKAVTLCHSSSSSFKFSEKSQTKEDDFVADKENDYLGLFKCEKAQLWFASSFGFRFVSKKNKLITIHYDHQQLRYQELIYFHFERNNHTINFQIVKPWGTEIYKLYVKGPLSELKKNMFDDAVDFDLENTKYIQQGLTAVAFAERSLDADEAENFVKYMTQLQNQVQDQNLILKELMSWATDLTCLGILGLKRNFSLRKSLVLEEAFRNDIKIWVVTDADEAQTLTDLNQLKILQNCQQPFNIRGQDEREIEVSIKNALRTLVDRRPGQQSVSSGTIRGQKSSTSNEKRRRKKKGQVIKDQKEVVFFNGHSLKHILKDETIKKTFLLLCSMCSYIVGSDVTAIQKADLAREVRVYNQISNIGYVLGVVSSPHDQYLIHNADITVGLNNKFKKTDAIISADIQLKDFYGVSYLLFKYGTQYTRRMASVQAMFNYRTFFFNWITIFYYVASDFSGNMINPCSWKANYLIILTIGMFLGVGIFSQDEVTNISHRIFGEYKMNFLYTGYFKDITILFNSIFDAIVVLLFFMQCWIMPGQTPMNSKWHSYQEIDSMKSSGLVFQSLVIFIRFRTKLVITQAELIITYVITLIALTFLFIQGDLIVVTDITYSPQMLLWFALVFSTIYLHNYLLYIYVTLIPNQLHFRRQFYDQIEERILFEEYEDPHQEFKIDKREPFFAEMERNLGQQRLLGINKNMMKLHRSDSLDEILEKINLQGDSERVAGNKYDNSANVISKVSLKLTDLNKELEYSTQVKERKLVQTSVKQIYVLLVLFVFLLVETLIFKLVTNYRSSKNKDLQEGRDQYLPLIAQKTITFQFEMKIVYIYAAHILAASVVIFIILKAKDLRADLVMFTYIIIINVLMCVQLFVDAENSVNDFVLFFIISMSFLNRQYAVYLIGLICFSTCFTFSTIRYNINFNSITKLQLSPELTFSSSQDYLFAQKHNTQSSQKFDTYFQLFNIFIIVIVWTVYAYQDELSKKIQFVTSLRKSKEYNKLLQIINILIPSLVRDRIKEGQKNFSDAQGEVTIIFIDIDQFDAIVSQYSGKELIELLDRLYNAFDQLCEQYGLSKIETVGKTYMACGGLKFFDSTIDQKLLSNHHTVRCADFAQEAIAVADKKPLKNGQKCMLKIGIHTGEVISGVVGETKPQFSLIGETVNKTSRVCSKCPPKQVLVSKETHHYLQQYSNNFMYTKIEAEMKGIGKEKLFIVAPKRRSDIRKSKLFSKNKLKDKGKNKRLNDASDNSPAARKKKEDYSQATIPEEGNESFRSQNAIDNSSEKFGDSEKGSVQYNDSDEEKLSNEVSEDEDDALMLQQLNFAQFKDDRVIAKNPTLNTRYNLVERPRFLLQFELKDKENEFYQLMLQRYKEVNSLMFSIKCILDSLMTFSFVMKFLPIRLMWVSIFWTIAYLGLQFLVKWALERTSAPETSGLLLLQVLLNFGISTVFAIIQSFFFKSDSDVREKTKVQILIVALMLFAIKSYPVRYTLFISILLVTFWAIVEVLYGTWRQVDIMTLLTNMIIFLICLTQLILMMFNREMQMRKQYNRDRIIDVEIEKNDELLSKLVPVHVLRGLKNDERIVEQIDNVTLLYTDMVGFTAFSKNVKRPQEVVQLLSQLFSKFDQLVDSKGVYKVHTIGDCYVVMGYTGKVNKYRRNEQIQVEEAYRVVQVGFEMIDIIRNVRESSKDPNLKNLDMRIGIHTGKIVGGIIGTKVVRYDIFGNDVLIANKMESNGVDSQVVISEATFQLLNKNQTIMDSMDFTQHKEIEIQALSKTVNSYLVEQINQQGSFYSSSVSYDSEEDSDEKRNSEERTTKGSSKNKNEADSDQDGVEREASEDDNE